MSSTETNNVIEVLFNDCYGGFGISKEALKRYNQKLVAANPSAVPHKYGYNIHRTDPLLLEVYHEMDGRNCKKGEGFNDSYSKTMICKINKKYENYFFISEYDGLETLDIRYHKYEIDEMRRIAKDETLSFEERINQINQLKVEFQQMDCQEDEGDD